MSGLQGPGSHPPSTGAKHSHVARQPRRLQSGNSPRIPHPAPRQPRARPQPEAVRPPKLGCPVRRRDPKHPKHHKAECRFESAAADVAGHACRLSSATCWAPATSAGRRGDCLHVSDCLGATTAHPRSKCAVESGSALSTWQTNPRFHSASLAPQFECTIPTPGSCLLTSGHP